MYTRKKNRKTKVNEDEVNRGREGGRKEEKEGRKEGRKEGTNELRKESFIHLYFYC